LQSLTCFLADSVTVNILTSFSDYRTAWSYREQSREGRVDFRRAEADTLYCVLVDASSTPLRMRVQNRTWSPVEGGAAPFGAQEASASLIRSGGPVEPQGAIRFAALAARAPQALDVYAPGDGQIDYLVQDAPTVVAVLTFDGDTCVHPSVLDAILPESSAGIAQAHALEGERALEVSTRDLGDFARERPGSALRVVPLAVRTSPDAPMTVRTMLGLDEATDTLRLAGDRPTGSQLRLMCTTSDRLLDGAGRAATLADGATPHHGDVFPGASPASADAPYFAPASVRRSQKWPADAGRPSWSGSAAMGRAHRPPTVVSTRRRSGATRPCPSPPSASVGGAA
jgi:hypothetical protein